MIKTLINCTLTLSSCTGNSNTDSGLSSREQSRADEIYDTLSAQADSAGMKMTLKEEKHLRCISNKASGIIGSAPLTQKTFERAFNQAESFCKGNKNAVMTKAQREAEKQANFEAQANKFEKWGDTNATANVKVLDVN